MKTAVGYVRVSTAGQAEEGISLESQRAKIESYCELHDMQLCDVISDEGFSGGSFKNRAGAKRLLQLIDEKAIEVVVVPKLDRLFRSVRDAVNFAELCKVKNVAFVSVHESLDTNTPFGKFTFHLLCALGEMERDQAAQRTYEALLHNRKEGFKLGGRVPYGFRVEEVQVGNRKRKKLVELPEEQEVLKRVRLLRDRGESLYKIAKLLTEEGIPTKLGRPTWHPQQVARFCA